MAVGDGAVTIAVTQVINKGPQWGHGLICRGVPGGREELTLEMIAPQWGYGGAP
jgi:hypothetical protein